MKCLFCGSQKDLEKEEAAWFSHCPDCFTEYSLYTNPQGKPKEEEVISYLKEATYNQQKFKATWFLRMKVFVVYTYLNDVSSVFLRWEYLPQNITPSNLQDKLPTLVLFS